MTDKKKICCKVYFNQKNFAEIAALAEKAGKRRGGLQLFTQKKNGLAGEVVSNTDGISRFLKYAAWYWRDTEASRLSRAAEIKAKERELQEEKARLGIPS
jgi:hypothetical protein